MSQHSRHFAAAAAARTLMLALLVGGGLVSAVVMLVLTYRVVGAKSAIWQAHKPTAQAVVMPPARVAAVTSVRALPGLPAPARQAAARRSEDGQFYFDTTVGSVPVRMVFDTGAGMVVLRSEDAARAGVPVATLSYSISIGTANGDTEAALVVLDTLRVGDITRRNVPAWVLRPGKLGISLLGQSFMAKLSSYRFEAGELTLRGD